MSSFLKAMLAEVKRLEDEALVLKAEIAKREGIGPHEDRPVADLDLPGTLRARVLGVLGNNDIRTIGQLARTDEAALRIMPNLGRHSVDAVVGALRKIIG